MVLNAKAMRQRLDDELAKTSEITTYKEAIDHVEKTKDTGSHLDVDSWIEPTIEPFMSMCTPIYKFKRKVSPVLDSLNQILPIHNDTELIQGGLLSEAVLHGNVL